MVRTKRIKFWLDDESLALLDKRTKDERLSRFAFIWERIDNAEVIPVPRINYTFYKKILTFRKYS